MNDDLIHPITAQSFAIIDREFGDRSFLAPQEYEVVRRIIHTTADFEFKHLVRFTPGAIAQGIEAISQQRPIVVDVGMVKQGIAGLLAKTFRNPVINALDFATNAIPNQTRVATGMRECMQRYPNAIFAIGNAPTGLLALCAADEAAVLNRTEVFAPASIVGAPVGFVAVLEAKAALASSQLPHIRIEGRKGGSPVAAAIVNALVILAWQQHR